MLNKISVDLTKNSENIKQLVNDLNTTMYRVEPLKTSLIDSFDEIKVYLPPYACTDGATLKDAVKHFMIMLNAIERQYQIEIKHSFKMAQLFSALSKRLDADEKRLDHLLATRIVSY